MHSSRVAACIAMHSRSVVSKAYDLVFTAASGQGGQCHTQAHVAVQFCFGSHQLLDDACLLHMYIIDMLLSWIICAQLYSMLHVAKLLWPGMYIASDSVLMLSWFCNQVDTTGCAPMYVTIGG